MDKLNCKIFKHDSNIVALQKLLNTTTKFKQPNYVSSFVFELRNDTKGAYYVQVLYKDQKPSDPIVLTPVAINGIESKFLLNRLFIE